jgi:hypothetical protein
MDAARSGSTSAAVGVDARNRRIERARDLTRDHVIGRIVQNVGRIAQRLPGFRRYL